MMAASVIDFQVNKIEMEFLHANQMSEFSHSLGQNRLLARAIAMSALPLMNRHRPPFLYVRKVPEAGIQLALGDGLPSSRGQCGD